MDIYTPKFQYVYIYICRYVNVYIYIYIYTQAIEGVVACGTNLNILVTKAIVTLAHGEPLMIPDEA